MVQFNQFKSYMETGLVIATLLIAMSSAIQAQTPVGTWVTIDDKRQVDIAHIRIYQEDGKLFGQVVKLLPNAQNRTCNGCEGHEKGRSIVGMTLIRDVISMDEKYWGKGKLFDPNSGREFDCAMWLDTPDILKVRASFGLSIIGRTQTWTRLK